MDIMNKTSVYVCFDYGFDLVLVSDQKGCVQHLNPNFFEVLGWSNDVYVGRSFVACFRGCDADLVSVIYQHVMDEGDYYFDLHVLDRSQQLRFFLQSYPIRS